ncbi:DUF6625 family protein [Vibrio vulnificus]|uniref:DUF6625 family protein n=1 Tax=Vibrio vulnificus TaxID=672 RepID=UPI0032EE213E
MKKISLVIPYFGKLNRYQLFAINQLSLVDFLDVNVIVDRNVLEYSSILNDANVMDVATCFINDNLFGVQLSELKKYPYKLCDYKPFFNLIFKFEYHEYFAFCDLDCIYNPPVLNKLLSSIPKKVVGGEKGHFMIFDFDSLEKIQEVFLAKADDYRKKNKINLFTSERHFALDEFLFLHRILERLHSDGDIVWERCFFNPLLDLDYKNVLPKNWVDTELTFSLDSIMSNRSTSNYSYIHLQKRKVIGDLQSINRIGFDNRGKVCLNETLGNRINLYAKITYKIDILLKRVKFRYGHHGISTRPSFDDLF